MVFFILTLLLHVGGEWDVIEHFSPTMDDCHEMGQLMITQPDIEQYACTAFINV